MFVEAKKLSLTKIRTILISCLIAVLCGMGGFWWGERVGKTGAVNKISTLQALTNKETPKDKQVDFGLFWEVWKRLEKNYLDPSALDSQKMVYGAISGMTASLDDPYTMFLPPSENKLSKEDLAGEFAGVGIQLGYVEKTLAVMAPLPGHAAEKAGVKAGDLILHIKDEKKGIDKDTDGMNLQEAVNIIRGPKGTAVILTMFREGSGKTFEVTLIRDTIVIPSVEMKFVNEKGEENENGQFAHLRVIRFGEKTMEEWTESVNKILAKKDLKGIVLDLRNNPGGFLQRAIDLASEFIPSGVVVKQQGRIETETFNVNHKGKLIGKKIVVLVNRGSASASEILAGALRDQLGVKLVGVKSFGKGTVQEVEELPNGAGLHITIAKWLLPSGKNIHKDGLEVDVEVKEASGSAQSDIQLIRAIKEL